MCLALLLITIRDKEQWQSLTLMVPPSPLFSCPAAPPAGQSRLAKKTTDPLLEQFDSTKYIF